MTTYRLTIWVKLPDGTTQKYLYDAEGGTAHVCLEAVVTEHKMNFPEQRITKAETEIVGRKLWQEAE